MKGSRRRVGRKHSEERRRAHHQRRNAYHRGDKRSDSRYKTRKRSPEHRHHTKKEWSTIEIENLTRNVQEAHLKHIFGLFAKDQIRVEAHYNDFSRALVFF